MAELNEKLLDEVTGGTEENVQYVNSAAGFSPYVQMEPCPICGINKAPNAVCPNCQK